MVGATPGDMGEMLLIKDVACGENKTKDPPFPTYYSTETPIEETDHSKTATAVISQDIYAPDVHKFTAPSIMFTETKVIKSGRDKTKAKLAKVKK